MSCKFPMLMYYNKESRETLFVPGKITKDLLLAHNFELIKNHNWYNKHSNFILEKGTTRMLVPCGRCTECRLQHSREVATRVVLEALDYTDNWCITLTYDDDNLVFGGEGRATLVPPDLKKFMKDLRRYFEYHYNHTGIRFYACGEYGDKNARPHYHLIVFNLPLLAQDVFIAKGEKSETGEDLFISPIIDDLWSKGRVRLNTLSWKYAAYCARYIMKKQLGKKSTVYDDLKIVPEFTRGSNRPGIGYNYLKAHEEKIIHDEGILLNIGSKVQKVPIPKYFIRKILDEGQFDITDYLERRQEEANATFERKMASYSGDIFDILEHLEDSSISKAKALIRH